MEQADAKHVSAPEEYDKPSRQSGLSWILWPTVALISYVLSLGPVVKVYEAFDLQTKHPNLEAALETCYYPLGLLFDNSPAAGRLYLWYVEKIWRVSPSSF